ncbi:MAG: hypothetical protein VYA84_12185 [Planctomycetota bacterium]|nr:hypothetical protein [Planctomycetota bacterium]
MKTILLMPIVLGVAAASCFQLPHASVQESGRDEPSRLQRIDSVTAERVD